MVHTEFSTQKRYDLGDNLLLRHEHVEMIVHARTGNLNITEAAAQEMFRLLQIRAFPKEF